MGFRPISNFLTRRSLLCLSHPNWTDWVHPDPKFFSCVTEILLSIILTPVYTVRYSFLTLIWSKCFLCEGGK